MEKELNIALAKILNPENLVFDDDGFPLIHNCNINEYFDLNYCQDWSLLMPLVIENNISLQDPKSNGLEPVWTALKWASDFKDTITAVNECPKIALAECLLQTLKRNWKHLKGTGNNDD